MKNFKNKEVIFNNEINLNERLQYCSNHSKKDVLNYLDTTMDGLTQEKIIEHRHHYGSNVISKNKRESIILQFVKAFIDPFTMILLGLAIVSMMTEIIMVEHGEKNYMTVTIILTMVFISGCLKFIQEKKSNESASKLTSVIQLTACVKRSQFDKMELSMDEIVVGDILYLSSGDMIPTDCRILDAKDLFISQSSLNGESEPVEKTSGESLNNLQLMDASNLVFMGSTVISGTACAVVVAVGKDTLLGEVAQELDKKPGQTNFEKGVSSVSHLLVRFMLVMVPLVFFLNGFTKGNWFEAGLFAISIAVGLTPEMLPMIVTTCLAKGAVVMSKKNVIMKNLSSIRNLGSLDILCTDKTGTLTQDKIELEVHLNIQGYEDNRVLKHAFLNSYYQTGLKNLMDVAIIEKMKEIQLKYPEYTHIHENYEKIDEIPFDFNRRRMSVIVSDRVGKTQLITKGAVEEMLNICSFVEFDNKVVELTKEMKDYVINKVKDFNEQGFRVLGVAHKLNHNFDTEFSTEDEKEMVLLGYLAFLDPPKKSAAKAIKALFEQGVDVKVVTGDNEKVALSVCKQVGLPINKILLGNELELLNDEELKRIIESTTIFAKVSPMQKARVVRLLQECNHVVGYMGDGINDAVALKTSDVGISVDTAVDIAKEAADVILLKKDLMVLEEGILEGRKTYANMNKYIKVTASSNFGNMFSVLVASIFLPFMPMTAIQILLLNLVYDLSCSAIPWDHVDVDMIKHPKKWDVSSIKRFMFWFGPCSSLFDILTFIIMYFIICPSLCGGLLFTQLNDPNTKLLYISIFQTGWFIESMWSQTLIIHFLRTEKKPFIQSNAALPLTVLTLLGIILITFLPFMQIGGYIGLTALHESYFLYLVIIIILYMFLVSIIKKYYTKRYFTLH